MQNAFTIAIVLLVVLILVIFIIIRNKKDRKDLEDKLNQDYEKPKEQGNDIDVDLKAD